MKFFIALVLSVAGFHASADPINTDVKFSAAGKIGRVSKSNPMFEIVGLTVPVDHDDNDLTATINVKAAVNAFEGQGAVDISFIQGIVDGMREDKRTVAISYDAANASDYAMQTYVGRTDLCLGKDFIYTHINSEGDPASKTCYIVSIKDFIITK